MIQIQCHTNLDILSSEEWPNELPSVPIVGDRIQLKTKHGIFQLELEVVAVRWMFSENLNQWISAIELHDPKHWNRSIREFYEWYAPKVNRGVSSFI